MVMQRRARSKKRGAPSVTSPRTVELKGQTKPLRQLDMALIEENEWLKVTQERYHW
jgi:hypothetical protein